MEIASERRCQLFEEYVAFRPLSFPYEFQGARRIDSHKGSPTSVPYCKPLNLILPTSQLHTSYHPSPSLFSRLLYTSTMIQQDTTS